MPLQKLKFCNFCNLDFFLHFYTVITYLLIFIISFLSSFRYKPKYILSIFFGFEKLNFGEKLNLDFLPLGTGSEISIRIIIHTDPHHCPGHKFLVQQREKACLGKLIRLHHLFTFPCPTSADSCSLVRKNLVIMVSQLRTEVTALHSSSA